MANPLKISLVVDSFYQRNEIFNASNVVVNRDDCMRQWIALKEALNQYAIGFDTVDIMPIVDADIVLFINIPELDNPFFIEAKERHKKIFCVISELDLIHKPNADLKRISSFDRIFTYQTNLVNNKTIFKLNYSFDFKQKSDDFGTKSFSEKKCITMISGNKSLQHQNELYSERVNIIKWFEKYHPADFEFYGMGWNATFFRRFKIQYSSLGWFKKLVPDFFSSYKGRVESKQDTLRSYKFSFCLENAENVPGWITEKLFDCLFNGCVPIYKGASEIGTVVPTDCFIDMSNYRDYEELYEYLYHMNEKTYNQYIDAISSFLEEKATDQTYEFGIPYFVKTITTQIKETK